VNEAQTTSAATCACPPPPKGDCCEMSYFSTSGGCRDATCEAAVVGVLPQCASYWDWNCMQKAYALCPKLCGNSACKGAACPCEDQICNPFASTKKPGGIVCESSCGWDDWDCIKCDPCVQAGSGPLTFTLAWDGAADYDLTVVAKPEGCGSTAADACGAAKTCPSCWLGAYEPAKCGGAHSGDVLCCAAKAKDNTESVSFASTLAAPSSYEVYVWGYACDSTKEVQYTLSVNGAVWKTGSSSDGWNSFTWSPDAA
jgi:hypothetical protein